MTREEQLAAVAEGILNMHLRVNGKRTITSDDGAACRPVPLGALLQLESALEGKLEREEAT